MKRILVHGSIAIDYIMDFEDNLYNNCFIDNESKSFHMMVMPTSKKMQFGGTGGNISYNLGLLNVNSELITSVGNDFRSTGYKQHLSQFKNLKLALNEYEDDFCANCYIVNDSKKQQLIVYHGGATQRIPKQTLPDKELTSENVSWAINSPENPQQMINVSQDLFDKGIKCILDTGQVTPALNKEQLEKMISQSELMICNEHELKMVMEKVQTDEKGLLEKISTIIMTKGADGSFIKTKNDEIHIPAVLPKIVEDPTGAGDGYRAGLLFALHQGLSIEYGCKVGATVGSFVVETKGGQTQVYNPKMFIERFEKFFGKCDLVF